MNRNLLVTYVQEFLRQERTLNGLQELLIPVLWADAGTHSEETVELANVFDATIAEFTGGHIPEADFHDLLRSAAALNPVRAGDFEPDLIWGSSLARPIRQTMEIE